MDVSGGDYRDFLKDNDLFVREGDNFRKRDLGFSGDSKAYDVDGDGMDDIVFYSSNSLGWVRNEGGGDFSSPITIATLDGDYYASGFVLKDIDDDGDVDIVTNGYKKEAHNLFPGSGSSYGFTIYSNLLPSVDYEASRLILYESLGDGSFKEHRPFKTLRGRGMYTWDPYGFIVEDIDNDGLQDVVIGANSYHKSLGASNYWYRQREDLLSFDDPIQIPGSPKITRSVRYKDINRDGHVDILSPDGSLSVYINNGDGVSFSKKHSFGVSHASLIDDLDGDGFQDIIYSRITSSIGQSAHNDDIGRVYWNRGSLVYAPVVNAGEVISNSSFRFSWEAGEYAESYEVYVAKDLSFNDKVSGYNGKKVSADITELLVEGLSPDTTYYYRVRSVGLESLRSPYSNYESVYLPMTIPGIPDALPVLDIVLIALLLVGMNRLILLVIL